VIAQRPFARLEDALACLDASRRLGARALELGVASLERPLALAERSLLLRELRGCLRSLPIGGRQLAELDGDLALALRRARLGGRELGLQIGEPLLLARERLAARGELRLAFLERGLKRTDACRAAVDLLRAEVERLPANVLVLEPRLRLAERGAQVVLARLGSLELRLQRRAAAFPARPGDGRGGLRRQAEPGSRRRASCSRNPVPNPVSVSTLRTASTD